VSWSKWGWLLYKINVPTKNFNYTQKKIQTTIYNKQLPTAGKRKKDKHNIRESRTTTWRMEERLEDGSRRQRGFALRRSSNTNTEVLGSFRWPHTRVVTTTLYIPTSTTFNRHQSQLPLTFKTFNTFYFWLPARAHVFTSLHTDWLTTSMRGRFQPRPVSESRSRGTRLAATDGLTWSVTGCFIAAPHPYGNSGCQRVNVRCSRFAGKNKLETSTHTRQPTVADIICEWCSAIL